VNGCSNAAMDLFFSYSWPGNIRELKNVLEAAFVTLSDQPDGMLRITGPLARSLSGSGKLDIGERTMLLQALTATNWNRTEAAKRLHWSRMTLYRKMLRYQVSPSVKLRSRFQTN
jgi:transcriptional regulator of acetoin/glycerol metabolism